MSFAFVASAISRQDGSPGDGINLLWTAPPRIGYSIDGFDIQRRVAQRRVPVCYVLTASEIQTLHQIFRVSVPPGLVTVRQTPCPEFPQELPDEPAPETDPPGKDVCIDFRVLPKGKGPNPRTEGSGTFVVIGSNGQPAAQSEIRSMGVLLGLDCGFRLEIELAVTVPEVELTVARFAAEPKVTAFQEDGCVAATATISAPQGQPETITLKGTAIRRVVVESSQNEALLLELCLRQTKRCIDFRDRPLESGPNPRAEGPASIQVGAQNQPAPNTVIKRIRNFTGLDCGTTTELTFATAVGRVELTMVHFSRPGKIAALREDGSSASEAAMTAPQGQAESLQLGGGGIRRVLIQVPQDEALLLGFCVDSVESESPQEGGISAQGDGGQPSRIPQPPFRLRGSGSVAAAPSIGISTLPSCIVYDIRLNGPHHVVQVLAGLPAMLAVALREGKAVNSRLVTFASGVQGVTFLNQVVDEVLLYAGQAASSLMICVDETDSREEDAEWAQVPFIAKHIHLPVRSVNPALGSPGDEDALASSRLLPGEVFDAASFHEVAQLMNDTSQNPGEISPMVQGVLTRENGIDPFIELRGWPYAFSLLMEAEWRRMLGFGFLDKGAGLVPGEDYDYRITGRFRRRELQERLLGFHTVPLGTTLPKWFQLESILIQTPLPAIVETFPKPSGDALRAVGVKGIALQPLGVGGRSLALTFGSPVSKVVLEFEPSLASGLHYQARTSDYLIGLSGSLFSGPIPSARRVELTFAEPVDTLIIFGVGFFYGVRVPFEASAGLPEDVLPASVVIPGVRYQPTPAPSAPPFLGTTNLQQPQVAGDPAITTQQPPQHLGFHLLWIPPPVSGSTVVPWPPDLTAFPPFDVLGFHLERRRVDTGDPFVDIDDSQPPVRVFGNRSGRRDPPQLYPGIDLLAVFPEAVLPEPPVSVLMDAEDTLRSLAKPAGPPPGSLHQYRIFSVDAIGRRSSPPTLGSVVRLEKRVPPPQPVGPTTPPPAGVDRTVGVAARVLQSLDTRLTPTDQALLGGSTSAIVLEWAWTQKERERDPFATEFRVYFRPIPPDLILGALTGTATLVGSEFEMTATLNQEIAADSIKGRYLRAGANTFKVKSNTAGQNITLRLGQSALDPAAVPVAAPIELALPPDAEELRPPRWPERTAIIPVTAEENYQFVFRDRLTLSATQSTVRVWAGVSAADDQSYIPDTLPIALPNSGRPGNESSIAAAPALARYLGKPVFTVPPPLPDVPEQVTNEPADDRVAVRLDLPGLLPAVTIPAGFTVKLERVGADALLNRISARTDDTIGARLPDGTTATYTLGNPADQAAFLAQIRSSDGARVEGRFIMDFLTRHLNALEPLWQNALPAPVAFSPVIDTLPGKAERYVHRIRLVDQAGHVSAGGAILPQFVRVLSLASPASPTFSLPGSESDTLTLTARLRDVFELRWLVLFAHMTEDSEKPDAKILEKPQLLRLPNRRDLYPSDGIRLRLADGTLLTPMSAVEVSAGTVEIPDRVLTVPIGAGFGKRVSLWAVAMTRDGITSRMAGPQTAFTGAPPLVVPALTVAAASGLDQASWGVLPDGAEASLERSADAGSTWTRISPWIRATSFDVPAIAGTRQYRLVLRASRGRRATGAGVIPT